MRFAGSLCRSLHDTLKPVVDDGKGSIARVSGIIDRWRTPSPVPSSRFYLRSERERERRGGTDGIREPSPLPGFDSTQYDECRNRFIDLEIDERGLHE